VRNTWPALFVSLLPYNLPSLFLRAKNHRFFTADSLRAGYQCKQKIIWPFEQCIFPMVKYKD